MIMNIIGKFAVFSPTPAMAVRLMPDLFYFRFVRMCLKYYIVEAPPLTIYSAIAWLPPPLPCE